MPQNENAHAIEAAAQSFVRHRDEPETESVAAAHRDIPQAIERLIEERLEIAGARHEEALRSAFREGVNAVLDHLFLRIEIGKPGQVSLCAALPGENVIYRDVPVFDGEDFEIIAAEHGDLLEPYLQAFDAALRERFVVVGTDRYEKLARQGLV